MVSSIIDLSEMRSLSSSLLTSLPDVLHGHCNTPEPPRPHGETTLPQPGAEHN